MSKWDRDLGMDRAITRRDFLNGAGVAIGATLVAPSGVAVDAFAGASDVVQPPVGEAYPPALTGLRGNHAGSIDAGHAMRDGRQWDTAEDTREVYDLIVVGAGMSGLAAAYFFRKKAGPNAKILILDNHDDFGGHARRNEFTVNGRLLIAAGGAQWIDRPWTYTSEGRELLKDIGIDFADPAYHVEPKAYASMGLQPSTYFDKETFGQDRLVRGLTIGGFEGAMAQDLLAQAPLSDRVRKDLVRLWTEKRDYLAGLSKQDKVAKLKKTSYQTYLLDVVKVDPDVLKVYHPNGQSAYPTHMTSAWYGFNMGYPGFSGLDLEKAADSRETLDKHQPKNEPARFQLPEGAGGLARLLLRSLIPATLSATSAAQAQMVPVRYARLDEPSSPVRLRLNSTVVHVGNNNADPMVATEAEVVYIRGGKAFKARGSGCVLACYNAVIPYMVPALPATQKKALGMAVRNSMVYTNVAVKNWTAFQKMGVSSISLPGPSYPEHIITTSLEQQISMGGYHAPKTPEEPIVVNMWGGVPWHVSQPGMTARDMLRATRAQLYATSFETFERRIRTHLARVLSEGGFDPARDIAAITVNRWGHAMAMGQNILFDPEWGPNEYPWVVGRQCFGRIAIANSDADGVCLTQAAFDQGYRAVYELTRPSPGWWSRV
jgi:spermidine dehydrogenase